MSGPVLGKRRPLLGESYPVAPGRAATSQTHISYQATYWSLWYRARSLPCLRFSIEGLQDPTVFRSLACQEPGGKFCLAHQDGEALIFRCRTKGGQRLIDQLLRLHLGGKARPERAPQVSYWSRGWLYF
jgi:hypothetical protein